MKKLFSLFLFLSTVTLSLAQNNFTVKGTIILPDGYLPAGNVMALNPIDSTLIKGDFFLDGAFGLTGIEEPTVVLQLTSLEFADQFHRISFVDHPIVDLGELVVNSGGVALSEVVVKSKRPVYKQHLDGTLEVLIESTTLAASNSINEILTKTPDVLTDEEGQISVFGKGNAIIYLNGKRITNSQLNLIAPANIKKIEIIRNPSAKYDADGAAVIHIQTIQKIEDGYQVNLKQNINYSTFGGTNAYSSIAFNQKSGAFTTNGFYSLLQGKRREQLFTTRNREEEALFLNTALTTDWEYEYDNYSNYGLGGQWDGEKGNYVSLEYSGFFEQLGGQQLSYNRIEDRGGVNFYDSQVDRDVKSVNHTFSLNYQQPLDTLGSHLFMGGQYATFTDDRDNLIHESSSGDTDNNTRLLKNIFDMDIHLYSGQMDFTKVFSNKNSLAIGSKYSLVTNGSTLDFLVANDGENFQINPTFSNRFNYEETIAAAYLSFTGQTNHQWQYTLGLRGEITHYDLLVSDQADVIQDRYVNLFPNFSIGKQFTENFQANFSYTSSIRRPAYYRLNPLIIYQDPYTSIQGNPNLIPEKQHAFEFGTQLAQNNFTLGYNYTIDPLGARAVRGNDFKSYILLPVNYTLRHEYFASVARTFTTKWWTSRNTLSLRHTDIKESVLDAKRITPKPNVYFYSNNTFNIANLFNLELLTWYLSDQFTGITHRQERFNLTLTVEKTFLDKALKIRLIANDIFHTNRAAGNYEVGATAIYFNRQWSSNYFGISIMYDFGKLKESGFKNRAVGEVERSRVR